MTISSLIVECAPEACDAVAAELSARDGVEVHGIDAKQGKVVVTVEADGIDESHRIRQFRRRQFGEVGLPWQRSVKGVGRLRAAWSKLS